MRKLVVLVVVALVNFSAFANNARPAEVIKSELRSEIIKLLGKANFQLAEKESTVVEFTVNQKGEIIVLTVNSNNSLVDTFVKNKLNYKVITNKNVAKGKTFKMPLTLIAE